MICKFQIRVQYESQSEDAIWAIGTTGYPDEKERTSDINFIFTQHRTLQFLQSQTSVSSLVSRNPDMVADQSC